LLAALVVVLELEDSLQVAVVALAVIELQVDFLSLLVLLTQSLSALVAQQGRLEVMEQMAVMEFFQQ
jgi:hypothetical protein